MKLKGALIGCGAISKKHLEAFFSNREKIELSAVCDIVRNNAETVVKEYINKNYSGTSRFKPAIYKDYIQMLNEQKPDVVAIATSSSSHYPITMAAFESNAHVMVEKPMALSTKEAEEIINKAQRKNLKITVCYVTRFLPHIQKLYKAIQSDKLGNIFHGSILIHWNRKNEYYQKAPWRGTWDKDGGVLMNQCIHGIDLLQWLMGSEVKKIYGVTRRFLRPIEAEDFGTAILEFKNGAVGTIVGTVNVYPENHDATLSIFGDTGTVVIGGNHIDTVKTWQIKGELDPHHKENNKFQEKNEVRQGHPTLYNDFIDAIINNREPLINGEEGKKSVDIVLGIYQSAKTGKPVTFPVNFDLTQMKHFFDK